MKSTCLKRSIPRRTESTASRALLEPPVKASQIPDTEGRKSLRVRMGGGFRYWEIVDGKGLEKADLEGLFKEVEEAKPGEGRFREGEVKNEGLVLSVLAMDG